MVLLRFGPHLKCRRRDWFLMLNILGITLALSCIYHKKLWYTIPNCDIPYWYIPCMVYTMVYHIQNASYHMCDITHVICNCDITYFVWYIPCDITYMVYTILWYTINCDIPWYIRMVYSIQFPVYTILNRYDIYHVIYLTYITWYIPCDIAFMWNDTCDIPLCVI